MLNRLAGLVVVLLCASVTGALADDVAPGNFTFGTRVGTTAGGNNGDFEQYDIFGSFKLPWGTDLGDGWQLETGLDVTLAIQDGEGESGGKGSVAGEVYFFSPARKVSLIAGLGVGLLEKEVYGEIDYAGPVFFLFNGGLNYWFNQSFSLGYRFHHESNGSIYDKNPSLNMHQLELRLHF